jgi:acetylornithine deacetylase
VTAVPDPVELLGRLVGFESVSHRSVLPIADFVCDVCDGPDVRLARLPAGNPEKVNLWLEKGPPADEDGSGLVLCGHLDVVPAGDGWTSPPFRLTDRGDRWVARGACDMKGFVALAVHRFLSQPAEALRAPLALLLTCDEETGSRGAQCLAETPPPGPLPRSVWVGEPTALRAVRLHKGHMRLRVDLSGQSAHSGYPHHGRNAIEPAGPVLVALADLRRQLAEERPSGGQYFPDVPFVALNVGRIAGGEAVNVVPDHCRVEIGVRLLPGIDPAGLLDRIDHAVRSVAPEAVLAIDNVNPALTTAAASRLYSALCRELGQSTTTAVGYSSDAGALTAQGFECVLCGPGSIEVAHRPDEFLPKDQARRAAALLETVVRRFCAAGDPA